VASHRHGARCIGGSARKVTPHRKGCGIAAISGCTLMPAKAKMVDRASLPGV
jgi:hypothetical protein